MLPLTKAIMPIVKICRHEPYSLVGVFYRGKQSRCILHDRYIYIHIT